MNKFLKTGQIKLLTAILGSFLMIGSFQLTTLAAESEEDAETVSTETDAAYDETEKTEDDNEAASIPGKWKSNSTGWWYELDDGGYLKNGEAVIGGKTYRFDSLGYMVTGWYDDGYDWYYYDASGVKLIDKWLYYYENWYYLDEFGVMATDKALIDECTYNFYSSGIMITGWNMENGSWYYYNQSGAMENGWILYCGSWYYLNEADSDNPGVMLNNQWKFMDDNWYFLQDGGCMATDWAYIDGNWYLFDQSGSMQTGWKNMNDIWYYMYEEDDSNGGTWGAMATNTEIDGYWIGYSGRWSKATVSAKNILDQIGWNLQAAYNWSAGLTYYRFTPDPSCDSEWFANYGFGNGYGNCYVMAATFCYMADALGYEAHQVVGYVPRLRGGSAPHSWCELVINGATYVFDPNFTNETGKDGYQFTYGTSGTWVYSDYYRIN